MIFLLINTNQDGGRSCRVHVPHMSISFPVHLLQSSLYGFIYMYNTAVNSMLKFDSACLLVVQAPCNCEGSLVCVSSLHACFSTNILMPAPVQLTVFMRAICCSAYLIISIYLCLLDSICLCLCLLRMEKG